MTEKIILLSDGTGNSDAALWRTNVWRLLNFIDRTEGQIVFYDKGIGTTSFLSRVFGRAFGIGLPHNVLALYKFLCQNYRDESTEIFAFGFSRGAYTIRAVIELVLSEGLVASDVSDVVMNQKVEAAYRAYRAKHFKSTLRIEHPLRALRDAMFAWRRGRYKPTENHFVEKIRFVGLWDTVGAYGVPFDGLARGFSRFVWPFDLATGHADSRVARVCHALSLDDERRAFYPILWNRPDRKNVDEAAANTVSEVWFAGEHSNLGGGNPDDSLAQISLYWMMNEATKAGLVFKRSTEGGLNALEQTMLAKDHDGRIHQSRQGFASLYRYAPRRVASFYMKSERAKIHESVFKRIRGRQRYAPIGLPQKYEIVSDDGSISSNEELESSRSAFLRSYAQERIWNRVWLRSILYYLTIAALIHLLLFPAFHPRSTGSEYSSLQPISQIIFLIGAFVPAGLAQWITAYARSPGWFLVSVISLIIFTRAGKNLEAGIKDSMRAVWWNGAPDNSVSNCHGTLYLLRMGAIDLTRPYSSIFVNLLAINIGLLFLWIALAVVNGLIFNFRDANGHFCESTVDARTLKVSDGPVVLPVDFKTSDFCFASGVLFEANGARYVITVEPKSDWMDAGITVTAGDSPREKAMWYEKVLFDLAVPFRRELFQRWFKLAFRYGSVGGEEIFYQPDPADRLIQFTTRPTRGGELFIFVNDAALGIPRLYDLFYRNNQGAARVTLKRTR